MTAPRTEMENDTVDGVDASSSKPVDRISLEDRREFLTIQAGITEDRIKRGLREGRQTIVEGVEALERLIKQKKQIIDTSGDKLRYCVRERILSLRMHCTDMIDCLSRHLLLSTTEINHKFFTNLFRIRYVFSVLERKHRPDGFRVAVLVDASTGEVSFAEALGEEPRDGRAEGLEGGREEYCSTKRRNDRLVLGRARPAQAVQHRPCRHPVYGFSTTNTPSGSTEDLSGGAVRESTVFSTVRFPSGRSEAVEEYFKRPFRIALSISEMNRSVFVSKARAVMARLADLAGADVSELLYFSSYEYYGKYGYNQVITTEELQEYSEGVAESVEGFLEGVENEKKNILLNLALNIMPGVVYSVDLSRREAHPYFYLLEWAVSLGDESAPAPATDIHADIHGTHVK